MSFRTLFAVALSLACSMSISIWTSVLMPVSAQAQEDLGVDINQFNPAIQTTDGFMLNSAEDQGHLIFGATLFFDYSRRPLSAGSVDVISDQLSSRLLLTFGLFDRIIVFGGFKFHLLMEGDDVSSTSFPSADGSGIGDALVGARFRLYGEDDDAFQFAFQGRIALPLGEQLDEEQTYGGEHTLMGWPEFLFQFNTDRVRVLANVGFRLRGIQNLGVINVGHELTWAVGATIPVLDERLDVIGEFYGATRLADFFGKAETPAEILGGVKYHFGPGATFGGGVSAGLTQGYGSPDVRVFVMLGFEQEAPVQENEGFDPDELEAETELETELDDQLDPDADKEPLLEGDEELVDEDRISDEIESAEGEAVEEINADVQDDVDP